MKSRVAPALHLRTAILAISLLILVRVLLGWPSILDFKMFAFRDLGSFTTLDQLLDQHLRLGVDVGYSYGFLPILLQRVCFYLFGPSYWTTLGLLAAYVLLIAMFWVLLARRLLWSWPELFLLAGLSEFAIWLIPTPAHALLQLSLLYSLYFFLKSHLRLALALSALGCLTIPSLPIILSGLLSVVIFLRWRETGQSLRGLMSYFWPAAVAYSFSVVVLCGVFGSSSVLPSLLPSRGMAMYRAMNFGFFRDGINFWHPAGARAGYYLGSPAGIWLLGSFVLLGFAGVHLWRILHTGLTPESSFVLLCCALHIVFIAVGYGASFSYIYYAPILAAGLLAGISLETRTRFNALAILATGMLGMCSQKTVVENYIHRWQTEKRGAETAGLYADPIFAREWSTVLSLSRSHRLFLLSYGNGADKYFPSVHTAKSWFLLPGLTTEGEIKAVSRDIRASGIVVEELSGPTTLIDDEEKWQGLLKAFPVQSAGKYFRIWSQAQISNNSISIHKTIVRSATLLRLRGSNAGNLTRPTERAGTLVDRGHRPACQRYLHQYVSVEQPTNPAELTEHEAVTVEFQLFPGHMVAAQFAICWARAGLIP
jgi:hypothetical protein